MNFWHMQLHPDDSSEITRQDALNIIENKQLIGMGKSWENDRGQPQKFLHEISIGDIVLVRSDGPLALVKVIGDCVENDDKSLWFKLARKIEIISKDGHFYKDQFKNTKNINWNEGLYLPTTLEVANQSKFIKYWYKKIINHQKMNDLKEIIEFKKQIILQGPPGTGKTMLAKKIAKNITAPILQESPQDKINYFFKHFEPNNEQLEFRKRSEELIQTFHNQFPKERLKQLSLEEYALGTGESGNFCWWIERGLKPLGYYFPGSSRSYLIYWNKGAAEYRLHGRMMHGITNPEEGIQLLMQHISNLVTNKSRDGVGEFLGDSFILKVLHTYYPEEFFPINSINCINNTLKILDIQNIDNNPITKNKVIQTYFEQKRNEYGKDITAYEFMSFLFSNFDLKGVININSGIIVSRGEYQLIQFHPSYNYEDFIRGISVKSDGKNIYYPIEDKTLIDIAQKALDNPSRKFVLIIDEINRANLSSVLGELIYSLEYRYNEKDDFEINVTNMYKKEFEEDNLIKLPNNLYIIGTMNTADRSVSQIDYAIRRRFAFVDVLPEILPSNDEMVFHSELFKAVSKLFISNAEDYLSNKGIPAKSSEHLISDFEPKDVWIGHSYFIQRKEKNEHGAEIMTPTNMQMRLEYEIKPILREYVKDGILKPSAKEEIEKLTCSN